MERETPRQAKPGQPQTSHQDPVQRRSTPRPATGGIPAPTAALTSLRDMPRASPLWRREALQSLHRSAGNHAVAEAIAAAEVHAIDPVEAALNDRSAGRPLEDSVRNEFEERFSTSFEHVQVHADGTAGELAAAVQARAFTRGRDIYFAHGQYSPETDAGKRLIAHELGHVVQQQRGDVAAFEGQIVPPDHPTEATADRIKPITTGESAVRAPGTVIQRQPVPQDAGTSGESILQRQPPRYYVPSESDVAASIIEALQQSNRIAGLNVDPAFETLNPYPMPFQIRVLTELYARGYFDGLLGYLASGTKADHKLIVAIRFTQCATDPSTLAYEDILEAQAFLRVDVALPSELTPLAECLDRERVRQEKRREEERRQRAREAEEEGRQRAREREEERFRGAFEPGSEVCTLTKGVMTWRLYPATSVKGNTKTQRMQIKFLPAAQYRDKTVTFLQTLREVEGGTGEATKIDIGENREVFRPFYGVDWEQKQWVPSNEGRDVGFRSQPTSATDPAAYLFDEPWYFVGSPTHGRVLESVAVVLETGETLGALTWGVGTVPAYAGTPTCADKPSADFQAAVQTFYTPKSPAPGRGQENYDLILDGFGPNDASLAVDHKNRLDSIAARINEIIRASGPGATKNRLVVGGFGDSMDTDPMAASEQRTRAVERYLTERGVPEDTLDLRPFGATWARYGVSTMKAREGRNRRVQIRLFYP